MKKGPRRHQGRLVSLCSLVLRDKDKEERSYSVVVEDDLSVRRMRIELLTTSGKWILITLDLLLGSNSKRFIKKNTTTKNI